GAHEDGQLADPALVVELEEVDALQLTVANGGLEAQDHGLAFGQLVGVGEVLQRRGDVGEDGNDGVAAFEAAEEDWAMEDDVVAQRLGEQVEVFALGGTAEGMRLG